MVQALTLSDIGSFLQSVLFAFDEYILFGFVLMCTFAVIEGVRNLLTWGR